MDIKQIVKSQKDYFANQHTKDLSKRKKLLKNLLSELTKREKEIVSALYADFKKSEYEAVMTETSIVISELKRTIKKLKVWAKPQTVMPVVLNFPSTSQLIRVIPWRNY